MRFGKPSWKKRILSASVLVCLLASSRVVFATDVTVDANNIQIGRNIVINDSSGNTVTGAVVVGNNTTTDSNYTTLLGNKSSASGAYATAVGYKAVVNGYGGLSFGYNAKVNDDFGVSVGYNTETADNAVAIGTVTAALFTGGVAIGSDSYSGGIDSVVIGKSSKIFGDGNVVVGSNAQAGEQGDDTVGGGMLGGSNGFGFDTGEPNFIKNSVAIGNYAYVNADGAVAIGGNASSEYTNSVAIGSDSIASDFDVVSFGHKATDINPISTDNSRFGTQYTRRLVNVSKGTSATDAATVAQTVDIQSGSGISVMNVGTNSVGQKKLKLNVLANGSVTSGDLNIVNGNTVYSALLSMKDEIIDEIGAGSGSGGSGSSGESGTFDGNMNNQKIINVKSGTVSKTSQDAVIGAQLWQTNQNVAGFASDIRKNSENIRLMGQNFMDIMDAVVSFNNLVDAFNNNKTNIDMDNLSDKGITNLRKYVNGTGVQSGLLGAVYNPSLLGNSNDDPQQDSVTKEDLDLKADIFYVDTGLESKADKTYVDEGLSGKADKNSVYTKEETDIKLANKADKAELDKKADTDGGNIDVSSWAEKLGTGTVEENNTGLVNGGAVYNAIKELDIGDSIVKSDGNTVMIGADDTASVIDVSGKDGNRIVRGIKTDGSDVTSAVNVGYLNDFGNAVIAGVNQGFGKLNDKINKTGAGAAALANLHPFEIDGDQKFNIAASIGRYHGESAGALGLFYRPTGKVMVNVSSTVGSSDTMFGAGISLNLDKNVSAGMSKTQMAKTIDQQSREIASYAQRLSEQDKKLEAVLQVVASQQKEIAELKAKVQDK
jgi:hypothetical protein